MVSESARATTAKEAAYRIDAPNSRARAAKLIALDEKSARVVELLAGAGHQRMVLASPLPIETRGTGRGATVDSLKEWLAGFAARIRTLIDELDPADLVVLVATAGEDAHLAGVIGDACRARGVPMTVLVIDAETASEDALSASLRSLRPYASMLVVARGHDYVDDMLAALRV